MVSLSVHVALARIKACNSALIGRTRRVEVISPTLGLPTQRRSEKRPAVRSLTIRRVALWLLLPTAAGYPPKSYGS